MSFINASDLTETPGETLSFSRIQTGSLIDITQYITSENGNY